MYPWKIEVVGAVIVRNKHYAGKDNQTGNGLGSLAEAVQDGKNKDYQKRSCGKNKVIPDEVVLGGYICPSHNRIEAKGGELTQGGGTWDRDDKKQPDEGFLVSGGRLNKSKCSGELPDVKADDAD